MSVREQRRLRHAVTQLAACNDVDIAWIMNTLTESQREHLTALIESATTIPVPTGDAAETQIDALFAVTPAFLVPRFRQALEQGIGEGRLTDTTRAVLATALHDAAAELPVRSTHATPGRSRTLGLFRRWLGMRV